MIEKQNPWRDENRILIACRMLGKLHGMIESNALQYENFDWSDMLDLSALSLSILTSSDRVLDDDPKRFQSYMSERLKAEILSPKVDEDDILELVYLSKPNQGPNNACDQH